MINVEYMNKIENTYENGSSSVLELPELSYFDGEQYDLYDNKDYAKFIADVERAVRNSYEYRSLINYLRNTEGMNCCSILENLTNLDSTKVKIEIHHVPYTLFSVTETVIKKRLHNRESVNLWDVCQEVMFLHYIGWVGLVPLSETVHELVHAGYIFIPTNIIRGNYKKFTETYYDYISPDELDALDNAEAMTKEYLDDISGVNNQVAQQMNIFNIHETYLKILNRNNNVAQGQSIIKNRITEIKSNKKKMYSLVNSPIRKTNILNIMNSET